MVTLKAFVFCVCIVMYNIENIASHTNTKRDTSSEIDPYAAYYEYYANQQAQELPDAIASNEINEKQGYATTMRDMFGSDAGIVLGTLGAILGSLAVVGVGINAANVGSLSTDQDSICTAVKTLGAIDVSSASTTDTTTGTELNALITAIEAVSTPSC